MTSVRHALTAGAAALVVLLALLTATAGAGPVGWSVGLGCGLVLVVATSRAAAREQVTRMGPADLVTLSRATLSCGVAALVAQSWSSATDVDPLVSLATLALVLDAVDGRVARATRTSSAFGGRLDGEADAFLMLVLSVHVAASAGTWVLAIGTVRYVFAAVGWWLPWMRAALPPRYWRKVVTATAGIALTFAASDRGPVVAAYAGLVLAVLLLAESFGRDVCWLWCRRATTTATTAPAVATAPAATTAPARAEAS
ncbi:CDP-alcohol phosphatidyltransferase family protein [Nocardioides sp. Soil805]|uniref:CDP-alcohol phosphatidyltransferase family protein n=1 Tax=Nocardioides sp. Soil805 TaxID=1736416 RepID=UPI0009EB49E7|nr:CDP-alcohol phosphatidyltransferase family protein [Nocardioides sp. Soil805]